MLLMTNGLTHIKKVIKKNDNNDNFENKLNQALKKEQEHPNYKPSNKNTKKGQNLSRGEYDKN